MAAGALVLLAIVAVRHEQLPRERQDLGAHRRRVDRRQPDPVLPLRLGRGTRRLRRRRHPQRHHPLFTLAIAFATRTETNITRGASPASCSASSALSCIVAPWNSAGGSTAGALACLAAALSYGVSYVYMRRYLTGRGTTPIALAASQISIGALILIVTAPVLADQAVDLQLDVVASVLALRGALGTGLAYLSTTPPHPGRRRRPPRPSPTCFIVAVILGASSSASRSPGTCSPALQSCSPESRSPTTESVRRHANAPLGEAHRRGDSNRPAKREDATRRRRRARMRGSATLANEVQAR